MYNFLLLGGDKRQLYLSQIIAKNGFHTTIHYDNSDSSFSLEKAIKNNHFILFPIPFTKDEINLFSINKMEDLGIEDILILLTSRHTIFGGKIPVFVKEHAKKHGIACYDYLDMEEITIKNTIATAEGAIAEAIRFSPGCLHKSKCLVTGFGRCGKTLALKLKGIDTQVTIADRKKEKLALAGSMGFDTIPLSDLAFSIEEYKFIFNTVPAPIIKKELVQSMNPDVSIIDIASAPGGIDFEYCKQQNIRAKLCPGLPGIYASKASAQILYEAIVNYLSERRAL